MAVTSVDMLENSVNAASQQTYKVNNNRWYLLVKRVFDIIASAVGGVVLLVPMLLLALAIRIESPGPAIYKQERLGKDEQPFMMYKFRSMHLDSEKNGPQWAEINDNRCTKIGRAIRLCHADELPQLWNVLKGEMSLVGPRPEREYFYQAFEKVVPDFRVRLKIVPGLTGLSQVNGCYDLTPEERFAYDVFYMENRSVWVDIKCLLQTVLVIFNQKGAR